MRRTLISALLSAYLLTACGVNMRAHYQGYHSAVQKRDFARATAYVESQRDGFYADNNELLYHLDMGMLLHLNGRYAESNRYLEAAKTLAQTLWTESVGEHAAAWLTTDDSLPYQGEDFEKVMIHVVAALNYLALGDTQGARVEARQVTNKLELYNAKYESKNAYRDDGFCRWLAGALAETQNDSTALNDAWIDYQKAIAVYEEDYAHRYGAHVPRFILRDAFRVLTALGDDFAGEFAALRQKYPTITYIDPAHHQQRGRVVLIHMNGEAPEKVDQFIPLFTGKSLMRAAFPKFVVRDHQIKQARITAVGLKTEEADNLTAIAVQNLKDHMGRIMAVAMARIALKHTVGEVASAGGKVMSKSSATGVAATGMALQAVAAVWQISQLAIEEADKRSWLNLPARIDVGDAYVDPGKHTFEVEFLDSRGRVVEKITLKGEVKAGQTLFLFYRTFY